MPSPDTASLLNPLQALNAPQRFGMWSEGREPGELECIAQVGESDYYRVSFHTDANTGRISRFSFEFYPCEGCETPRLARVLPDFSVHSLSESYSADVLRRVLGLKEQDLLPLLDVLFELRSCDRLNDLIPDRAAFEERIEEALPEQLRGLVQRLLTHNNLPAFVAEPVVEAIGRLPASDMKEELFALLCKHVGLFAPDGRKVVVTAACAHVRDSEVLAKTMLAWSDPSPTLLSTTGLPARLGCCAVQHLLNVNGVRAPLIAVGNMTETVAKQLSAFLMESSRFDEPGRIHRHIFEHAVRIGTEGVIEKISNAEFQRFLNETKGGTDKKLLLSYLGKRSDDSTKTMLKYAHLFDDIDEHEIVSKLVAGRRLHVVSDRLMRGKTLSGKEALAALEDPTLGDGHTLDQHLSALARHRAAFRDLGDQQLFDTIARLHSSKEAAFTNSFHGVSLDTFHDLSFASAKKLLEGSKGPFASGAAAVLGHLGSFRLSRDELNAVMDSCRESEPRFLSILLESLDTIPESYLRHLEQRFRLHSYAKECGVPSVPIFEEFVALKNAGTEELSRNLVREVRDGMEALIGSAPTPPGQFANPRVRALLSIVYPGTAEVNAILRRLRSEPDQESEAEWQMRTFAGCTDRTSDLAAFVVRPVYRMNLAEGVELVLKPGATPNQEALLKIQQQLERETKVVHEAAFDLEKMERALLERVKALRSGHPVVKEQLETELLRAFVEIERRGGDRRPIADVLVLHQLVTQQHVRDYLQMTAQRSEKAKNSDYAQMLEWHEYYGDRLRDSGKALVQHGFKDEALLAELAAAYHAVRSREFEEWKATTVHRFQIDKLGLTPGFKKKLAALEAQAAAGNEGAQMAAERMLEAERGRVAAFLSAMSGTAVDSASVRLDSFNAQEIIRTTVYHADKPDARTLTTFFGERLLGIFQPETALLGAELKKYVPATNQSRRAMVLEGFITKNLASSRARSCGGVCVAEDNPPPGLPEQESQWTLPNYFQLVLRDPATKICVGLVLLHHYEVDGKRILAASFNPSATYVFKVDERLLFHALLGALAEFAMDNDFSSICCSKSAGIRTNRTGGAFAGALNECVSSVRKTITLPQDAPFSFRPSYRQREFDVIWERPAV